MITKHLSCPLEVKALSGEGRFEGYGSVFGVKDAMGDAVQPGAFKASLADWSAKGRLPALLASHDPARPVGKWVAMAEDSRGLAVEGLLAVKSAAGADTYELLKAGAFGGLSIGYSIPRGGATWDAKTETTKLTAVELWEVSLVSMPANPAAQIEAVKEALSTERDLERFLRDAGLSRRQARALISGGYKALSDPRDAEDELSAVLSQFVEAKLLQIGDTK